MPKSPRLKSKSPAEFFAEHQNIAGFDNPGKSLYTTVREFVENSLDAAEIIGVLPEINLTIEEIKKEELESLRGYKARKRKDLSLYESSSGSSANKRRKTNKGGAAKEDEADESRQQKSRKTTSSSSSFSKTETKGGKTAKRGTKRGSNVSIFRITCTDNGAGMPHDKIPRMLGVVLSSTKYGVKQTRGKFGLGAKMALVWAKKSTGMPVEVESAREGQRISRCKLDIDIYKNEPRVLLHERQSNPEGWRGTKISVVIEGNWKNYRKKILSYMRQLAVITPYASFAFSFRAPEKQRCVELQFDRRAEKCPPLPTEVKHHPSSVNNLIVESLINHARGGTTLVSLLTRQLSCISKPHALRLIEELGPSFDKDAHVHELSKRQIQQLTSLLRDAKFKAPDGKCLSPAGEYNIRLGIMKELNPDVVATFQDKASVHEGHPFVVEAAVSLGGNLAKPGLNFFRYANRIPLLFEEGSDIVAQIATKKIRWGGYKIKATDKVGVFVSIVSTKIPFKGTSKEYIGDDNGPLHKSVKKALSQCCVQLKKELTKKHAAKDQAERKKALKKYIPDVGRALIQAMKAISREGGNAAFGDDPMHPDIAMPEGFRKIGNRLLAQQKAGEINEKLTMHVERIDKALALEFAEEQGRSSKKTESLFIGLKDVDRPCKYTKALPHPGFSFKLLAG
eukprot:jgi/Bigna1/53298/estExt_Genewise1Plus.C_170152